MCGVVCVAVIPVDSLDSVILFIEGDCWKGGRSFVCVFILERPVFERVPVVVVKRGITEDGLPEGCVCVYVDVSICLCMSECGSLC